MKLLQIAFACILIASNAACTTNPATGASSLVLVSSKKEQRIGRKLHQDILKNETLYDDPNWDVYVNLIGQEIAANSDWPDQEFRFFVLDSQDVNAFALPNGHIFITTGMLSHLTKESHLAAVLAHEIAHVTARHTARKLTRNTLMATLSKPLSFAMWSVPGLGLVAGKKLDAQLVKTQSVLVQGYGRELELQADTLGAKYLAAAGYQPEDMLEVLTILKDHEEYRRDQVEQEVAQELELGVSYHASNTNTHPSADKRLQEVISAAEDYIRSGAVREDRENYFTMVDGLKINGRQRYALDPDWAEYRSLGEGLFGYLPFTFEPLDFELLSSDHALYLPADYRSASYVGVDFSHKVYRDASENWQSKYLSSVLMAHTLAIPANRSPKEFLLEFANERAQGLDYLNHQEVVSKFGRGYFIHADAKRDFVRAAPDSKRVNQKLEANIEHLYGVMYVGDRAVVIENFGGGLGLEPPLRQRLFLSIMQNIRDSASTEIYAPVRREQYELAVYQVQPGDTFASLTQNVMLENAAQKLRLVNGMYPNRQLHVGQKIKIFSVKN